MDYIVLPWDHLEGQTEQSSPLPVYPGPELPHQYTTMFQNLHCKTQKMLWYVSVAFAFPRR